MAARSKSGKSRAASAPGHGAERPRRVLHLDTFSGISGNMFLGALLDAGLSQRDLEAGLAGLGVPHRLRVTRVRRGALAARYVEVEVPGTGRRAGAKPEKPRAKRKAALHTHGAHPHPHDHDGDRPPHRDPGHEHGRSYDEIRRVLARAKLLPAARDRAQEIFAALAQAEARVHGIAVARVHFHEVGAIDAIVDVAGAALALELLGVARVTATPPALGYGTVETAHGRLPLPPPAVLELLRGSPVVPAPVAWETVTPTGAAILRTIVDEWCALPAMTIDAIGHGAGNDRAGPLPNVLRAVLGRSGGALRDTVSVLTAHLDDLVPEHFDLALERLLAAGALDVALAHAQMKKNRPGYALTVIAPTHKRAELARLVLRETGSLGVRVQEAERLLSPREVVRVATPHGRLRVKLAYDTNGAASASAEYDDAKRIAELRRLPLSTVIRAAEDAALRALTTRSRRS
ncbi:MAG TPA: nickel pincer cofactor biosynthesis protein LarC [Myxococcota bacterium]|nr:nickel pincer cofactor biosynthesis protein LarC [Myxococcota bacterium]